MIIKHLWSEIKNIEVQSILIIYNINYYMLHINNLCLININFFSFYKNIKIYEILDILDFMDFMDFMIFIKT